jgi:hypothetical protein
VTLLLEAGASIDTSFVKKHSDILRRYLTTLQRAATHRALCDTVRFDAKGDRTTGTPFGTINSMHGKQFTTIIADYVGLVDINIQKQEVLGKQDSTKIPFEEVQAYQARIRKEFLAKIQSK